MHFSIPPRVTSDWLVGDAAGPAGNTTNIALKGIITLRSMTEIQNSVIGKSNEASKYLNAANLVLEQSIQLSDYGSKFTCESSTAEQSNTKQYLLRALYADKILGSNFVPESVYERQRTRFTSDMSMERYGVPITDRNNFTTITHKHFTVTALSAGNLSFFGNLTFTTVKNYTRVLVNTSLTALAHTHDNEIGVGV
ncbi:hypothetical protein OPQ81_005940 [Rhizoctonia solani]|nr:hypothetical protein OPQ81_005940 [Rhizoctonia solani]